MLDSQRSVVAGLLRILSCPLPQPFLCASQSWFSQLLIAQDSLHVNCDFALHLNLAVEIVTEAKESTGCQFLHAFPSQSSLGYLHSQHRAPVAFVTLPWSHTSLFCREQQISALFPGAAASTPFFCLAKRKKKVTFQKGKKKIHRTGIFSFPFCSSL